MGRHRQRRTGAEDRPRREDVDASSTRPRWKCTRSRPRPTAGSTSATSPDGKIYQVAADGTSKTFFDPDDKYIWALATASRRRGLRRHRREGQHLPDHARRQGIALLQDQHHQRRHARDRQDRQPARRHGIARTDLPHRHATARRSCCSTRRSRKSTRSASRPTARSTRRRSAARRAARTARAADHHALDAEPPRHRCRRSPPRSPRSPSSTPLGCRRAVAGVERARAQRQGRDLPHPAGRAVGHGVGGGGRLAVRPADRERRRAARRHRQGRQDFRCRGDPARATLLARASARQVTALMRDAGGPRSSPPRAIPARCSHSRPTRATHGTYESDVRDAGTVATWGAIRWRASAEAGRSRDLHAIGQHRDARRNMERVVEGVHASPNGEHITSPNARYLQWRAVLIRPRPVRVRS